MYANERYSVFFAGVNKQGEKNNNITVLPAIATASPQILGATSDATELDIALHGDLVTLTATFTDDPVDEHTALVDWGDGSVPREATIEQDGDMYTVTGVHVYDAGGIYPITATCLKAEHEVVFKNDPFIHISTFGGAEVGCPVALKVLEISSAPAFLSHVQSIAEIFAAGFQALQPKHPEILVGLRQLGLMMGIEMVNPHCGPVFSRAAYDSGLLSVFANNDPRVAQLLPPLTIDASLAEEIVDRVDRALGVAEAILLD